MDHNSMNTPPAVAGAVRGFINRLRNLLLAAAGVVVVSGAAAGGIALAATNDADQTQAVPAQICAAPAPGQPEKPCNDMGIAPSEQPYGNDGLVAP